jgi:hypothetical protein
VIQLPARREHAEEEVRMHAHDTTTLRLAGLGLLLSGVGLLAASFIFPTALDADSYRELTATVLNDGRWKIANWCFLLSMLTMAVTLWLLADSGYLGGDRRVKLALRAGIVSSIFLSVDMAVLVTAYHERAAYRAGEPTPLVDLGGTMDAVGWPVFGVALAVLVWVAGREHGLTPDWAAVAGAVGALTVGLAALTTAGLHWKDGAYLYVPGLLLWAWLVWAGVALLRPARAANVNTVPTAAD